MLHECNVWSSKKIPHMGARKQLNMYTALQVKCLDLTDCTQGKGTNYGIVSLCDTPDVANVSAEILW